MAKKHEAVRGAKQALGAMRKRKLKTYNVFYTPLPAEHEVIVEAYTLKEAVAKVRGVLEKQCQSIIGGWEILER